MNEVRDKLLKNVVEPAADGRSSSMLTGTVTQVNEKANTCSVSYTKQDGKNVNKQNVPILLSNKGMIDWFPEEKEEVLLQEKNNRLYIMGPSYTSYNSIRDSIKLKNDVFSNSFMDVLGGFLF